MSLLKKYILHGSKILSVIGTLAFLAACTSSSQKKVVPLKIPQISSGNQAPDAWEAKGDGLSPERPLWYAGPNRESIQIQEKVKDYRRTFGLMTPEQREKIYDQPLLLRVDTSQIIPEKQISFSLDSTKRSETPYYSAFPVVIFHQGDSPARFGYLEWISLYVQVEEENDTWLTLSYFGGWICGTGLNDLLLDPGDIVISSVPVLKGEEKRKMRVGLRMGEKKIYSNEFWGEVSSGLLENAREHHRKVPAERF